jgi:hypothetical protein
MVDNSNCSPTRLTALSTLFILDSEASFHFSPFPEARYCMVFPVSAVLLDEVGGQRGTVSFHRPTRTSLAVSPDGPWSRRPARNLAARFQPSLPKPDRHLSAHPAFQGDGSTGIGFIPLAGSRPPPRPLGSVHPPLRPFPVSWALPQAVEYYDRSVTISLSADR